MSLTISAPSWRAKAKASAIILDAPPADAAPVVQAGELRCRRAACQHRPRKTRMDDEHLMGGEEAIERAKRLLGTAIDETRRDHHAAHLPFERIGRHVQRTGAVDERLHARRDVGEVVGRAQDDAVGRLHLLNEAVHVVGQRAGRFRQTRVAPDAVTDVEPRELHKLGLCPRVARRVECGLQQRRGPLARSMAPIDGEYPHAFIPSRRTASKRDRPRPQYGPGAAMASALTCRSPYLLRN